MICSQDKYPSSTSAVFVPVTLHHSLLSCANRSSEGAPHLTSPSSPVVLINHQVAREIYSSRLQRGFWRPRGWEIELRQPQKVPPMGTSPGSCQQGTHTAYLNSTPSANSILSVQRPASAGLGDFQPKCSRRAKACGEAWDSCFNMPPAGFIRSSSSLWMALLSGKLPKSMSSYRL